MSREQTIAFALMMRRAGAATRRRAVPVSRHPRLIEYEYARALINIGLAPVRAAIAPLLAELSRLVDGTDTTGDAERVHALIEQARRALPSRELAAGLAARFAERVSAYSFAQLDKQTRAALGVPLEMLGIPRFAQVPGRTRTDAVEPKLGNFVSENVALIKSLGDQPLTQIEQLVTRAFGEGTRHETLGREILAVFDVSEKRARLIARDQIGKLNGQVTRDRHEQLGLKQWRWLSARDKAVRDQHAMYDRQSHAEPFDYVKNNPGVKPGQEVACRCQELPVFDDVLAELDALEGK